MYKLIIVLLIAIFVPNYLCAKEYYLKQDFSWKYQNEFSDVKIKSVFKIENSKKDIIIDIYNRAKKIFPIYANIEKECKLEPLVIHIISLNMINSEKYFYIRAPSKYYICVGRYFEITPAIYITPQVFTNTEDLAHELAHYFYDMCNVNFESEEAEDTGAYKFEKYFLDRK